MDDETPAIGPYWYLVGFVDPNRRQWRTVIQSMPLRIGRRSDAGLYLYSTSVSHEHAEIFDRDGELWIRDLGSTNGTWVNADRVTDPVRLREGDTLHFADLPFRLGVYRPPIETDQGKTRVLDTSEMAVHLLGLKDEFEELMATRAIRSYFQAVMELNSSGILGYEVLSRGRLGGIETVPTELFFLAERLGLECELSQLCRHVGVDMAQQLTGSPLCFFNTHPGELQQMEELVRSLSGLRRDAPDVCMVVEIHEGAVTEPEAVLELRSELESLDIRLAFDDFGTGQSRLLEICEAPPHYLKFDMGMIRNLHQATQERFTFLEGLVDTARSIGIIPIAEGVESKAEVDACRDVGFEYAQGFFLSLPRPLDD
ncbi:MAG: EAL domain-containing protein [Acidobacteriota bacterium]|nr:EAL domain-containing protein [Acidobacteriota bacterium]